jgi:8-oxo-dGTP diphosphatase
MSLPYKIATLLYCFNQQDETLLLRRTQKPNLGLWSPCGGKLHMDEGESPYACACREAGEEIGLKLAARDLHLTGIVSEHGYEGQGHWVLFLCVVLPRLTAVPPAHREGDFAFFAADKIAGLPIPKTDLEQIWPLFWRHRGGFFSAHCHCRGGEDHQWTLEESAHGRTDH